MMVLFSASLRCSQCLSTKVFNKVKVKRLLTVCRFSHTKSNDGPLDMLKMKDRGIFENIFPNTRMSELKALLEKPQSVYCGFDPTADSLHIGNLISIIALLHAQRAGHSSIAVIGGATACIGDPSGKTKDRPVMSAEAIENNVISIMNNVKRIADNHDTHFVAKDRTLPKLRIVNNQEWYKDTNVISFLSSIGRHFRLGEMISRHSVQSRLNSKEGISCTEFMYQLFQAADWLHLFQNYGCTIQIGGNDQQGNIASGFDLIHKATNQYVFGFLTPLLLSPSGEKLGKSKGNALWLNADKTSPFEFYQYFINLPDSEVEKFLKLFTFYSDEEIEEIVSQHRKEPERRIGQTKLAESLTALVHGDTGLVSAQICTEVFFKGSISALQSLNETDLTQVVRNTNTVEVETSPSMTVLELTQLIGCFNSDAEANRIIKAGGFYINQQRVNDPGHRIIDGHHILSNRLSLIRVGKKTYHLVKWR